MFLLNILPVMQARNIENPHAFLVKNGFHRSTAHLLVRGQRRYFHLDHIEKLCLLLFCQPNDLLLWTPDKNEPGLANHPLQKLREQIKIIDWKETLATIPLHQLKNISIHNDQ